MDLRIYPRPLRGTVPAIASKSEAHRLLILAALCGGPTEMELPQSSGDIESTLACLRAMGAVIERSGALLVVAPPSRFNPAPEFDCGESGSTLRFLLPVAAAFCGGGSFRGGGRLPERPLGGLAEAMKKRGVSFSRDKLPFTISGTLEAGEYELPGNVSSQYITGLLLALPALAGNSTVRISGRLESAPYVQMTLAALRRFGIGVQARQGGFAVEGGQKYISPGRVRVEGDWSNAAFFLAAGALGGPVTVTGLDRASPQGDRAMVEFLARFGARTEVSGGAVTVSGGELQGCSMDLSGTPDLLPPLAAVAAWAKGETEFTGCGRLRYKESDRLLTTAAMIRALGGEVIERPEGLVVRGGRPAGGTADSSGDHRIAMAAAIAATRCSAPVTILDAGAIDKSYPAFFDHYRELGGGMDGI